MRAARSRTFSKELWTKSCLGLGCTITLDEDDKARVDRRVDTLPEDDCNGMQNAWQVVGCFTVCEPHNIQLFRRK
jgi:hypothetical protein